MILELLAIVKNDAWYNKYLAAELRLTPAIRTPITRQLDAKFYNNFLLLFYIKIFDYQNFQRSHVIDFDSRHYKSLT